MDETLKAGWPGCKASSRSSITRYATFSKQKYLFFGNLKKLFLATNTDVGFKLLIVLLICSTSCTEKNKENAIPKTLFG